VEKVDCNLSTVYLSLGSNIGDRFQNLQNAIHLLGKNAGRICSISSVYENPPLGFDAEESFYNICLKMETSLLAEELLIELQRIEAQIGRVKESVFSTFDERVYTSRLIDIDIVLFEQLIISTKKMTIPHPAFTVRKFVLLPLNEIAPNMVDPNSGEDISSLLKKCQDQSLLNPVLGKFKLGL
jgi:deoxyguanosine kinase